MFSDFLYRARALILRASVEAELDDELRVHLERQAEKYIESGLSAEEAERRARMEFGGVEQVKEECRDSWGVRFSEELVADVRYGLRQLRRNPGFAIVAVLTLALGIGANTAMFSVINAVLFPPLPYRSPEQLAMLWTEEPSQDLREERSAYWNVEQWRRQSKSFADMAFWDSISLTLTTGAEHVRGVKVSPNFFRLLGIQPLLGRTFSEEETEQRQRLVLISHRFWQTRFGGSPEAIGASIELDGFPYRIIGVLPAQFRSGIADGDAFLPYTVSPDWEPLERARGAGPWFVLGRLRPDITIQQAQAEMNTIARRLDRQLPASVKDLGISVVPLGRQVAGPTTLRLALWMLTGAVFFVLLIAATNVASLLLARSASREREMAIRSALGAGRARIMRQLLAESLTLAVISGVAGLLVARVGIRLILVFKPSGLTHLNEIGLDPVVLCMALVLCLFTGILVGFVPALNMARGIVMPSGQEGGRGISSGVATRGIRRYLIVTEFALATILLVGAGLLIRSLWSVEKVDPGFGPEQVLSAQLATPASMANAQRVNFYRRALEQVESLPGVMSAGIIGDIFFNTIPDQVLTTEGASGAVSKRFQFRRDEVSEGFFTVLMIPLLKGRLFSVEDGPDSPRVAIINRVMALRLWPGLDPMGRRFKIGPSDSNGAWFTVVGIVGDIHRQGLEKEPVAQMFEPLAQNPSRLETLLMRISRGNPLMMVGALRKTVHQLDKQVPVYNVATLEDRLGVFLGQRRLQTSLLIAFSSVALLMAAIGIFGLIQYLVVTRTHEIGIRMALGAQKIDVFRMVIGQGLKLAVIGLIIGIAGAIALTQFLSSLLYGVKPTDPLTFFAVSVILIAVALLACYFPARRAAKVDPMTALRFD